jgi:hypothetical protein
MTEDPCFKIPKHQYVLNHVCPKCVDYMQVFQQFKNKFGNIISKCPWWVIVPTTGELVAVR